MNVSPRLALALAAAVALDIALQLVWKLAAGRLPDGGAATQLAALIADPAFFAVAVLLALQFLNWLDVLGHADLSFAHAVVALSLVGVVVLSWALLAEPLTALKVCGSALVLAGVLMVGSTPVATGKATPGGS